MTAALDVEDLDEIRAKLDEAPASALQWLFPNGRLIRNEFHVGDIGGAKGDSLKFNVRKLKGKDWSGSDRGFKGVLSIFIGHAGSFLDGLDLARRFLCLPARDRPQPKRGAVKGRSGASGSWTQVIPPPAEAGRPNFARLWTGATFRAAWAYRDAAGGLLFYVARYEQTVTGKDGKAKR